MFFTTFRFHNVCLSALETDCRYTGAVRVCDVNSEYPNGFVKRTAVRGVATYVHNKIN